MMEEPYMSKYFGTDGFRGEANVDLTVEHAFRIGRFLGWYYSREHENTPARIVIGKDGKTKTDASGKPKVKTKTKKGPEL